MRAERAARAAACRDFETASCVTQQVLTTWISPPVGDLGVAVAEQPLTDRLCVGERDLATEEARREGRHAKPKSLDGRIGGSFGRPEEDVCGPAVELPSRDPSPAGCARLVADEIARRDRAIASTRARIVSTGSSRTFATTSSAGGSSCVSASTCRRLESTSLASTFARVTSTAIGSLSTRHDRSEAETGGGDREHARAAADVEHRPTPRLRREQLDAETRRRVRARAERTTGVDHDRTPRIRRLFPRWPEPEPTGQDGPVERAPRVLPALVDGLARAPRRNGRAGRRGAPRRRRRRARRPRPAARAPRSRPGRARATRRAWPRRRRPRRGPRRARAVITPPSGYDACSHQLPSSRSR